MLRRKPMSSAERVRYLRIREKILEDIEYLSWAAKELPESQLRQVYNKETLNPLFKAVFSLTIPAADHKEYVKNKESKEMREKRLRMLKLSCAALDVIGSYNFVGAIVPEPVRPYLSGASPPIENFRALYYMSLQQDEG
jgi:hypothetical protein